MEAADRNPFAVLDDDDEEDEEGSEESESHSEREDDDAISEVSEQSSPANRKRSRLSASIVVPRRLSVFTDSRISFLTYNVLADHLCKPSWFPYRKKDELDWRVRREKIKERILEADCGIVCLQEIQVFHGPEHLRGVEHHFSWFDQWLRSEKKYTGALGSRQNASGGQQAGIQLGNLLYWKQDLFEPLLVERCVPLLRTVANSLHGDKEMKQRFCNSGVRGTVATMVALQCRSSGRVIVVATTHLPAPRNDTDGGSKLEQLLHSYALLQELSIFVRRIKKGVDAIFVCGDLNSCPGNEVCQLLENGRLSKRKMLQMMRLGGQLRAPFVDAESGKLLVPSISLANRKGTVDGKLTESQFFENALKRGLPGRNIRFTNHTEKFTGWLDHIYFMEAPGVTRDIRTEDPSEGLDVARFLPDPEAGHGSDHLPVKCEVTLTRRDAEDADDSLCVFERTAVGEGDGDELEEEEIDFVLVDSLDEEAQAVDKILAGMNDSVALCVDVHGANLSRFGRIGLILLQRVNINDESGLSSPVAFDAIALDWKGRGVSGKLKNALEDPTVVKIGFDIRRDSEALFHLLGVKMTNVLDLQVLDQGIRLAQGQQLPERTQSWVPHLPSLNKVAPNFLSGDVWRRLKRPNPCSKQPESSIWTGRPLSPLAVEYAVCLISMITSMFFGMRKAQSLPKFIFEHVELHCRRALCDFRDREIPVPSDGDKKAVMEEISILSHWSGNSTPLHKIWKRNGLLTLDQEDLGT